MRITILATLLAASLAAQTPAKPKLPAPTVPSYRALKFPGLRQVKIPDVGQFTLSNGIRVYLIENHELPLVGGFALVRTGNLFDPADKVGLAQITGSVMRTGGTKTKTGDQLDEALENIAASVEAGIGETNGTVSFNALKENTDAVLDIFRDLMMNPEFRQDKIDLAKNQMRSGIARRNDEASGIAGREFTDIVYGKDNPYGWTMEYKHVDNIKRDDLLAFYKRYFFPANIMLAVQGDFNTAEMRTKLEKLFADWKDTQPTVPAFPAVTTKATPGVHLATKDDVTQSFFQMGHLGGVFKDKDYPALSVMADILGGGFASRLFTNVRTKAGLAYSISGNWGANYGHPGLFQVSGSTKSPSTLDSIQAARAEIESIRTAEVTDQDLETAKQSVMNSFVFFFDHPNKILNRLVTYEYWGYPKDFIFQQQKAVAAVTKADVLRVAKEHLKPEQMVTVVVGKPSDFAKPLSALGQVKPVDLTIPEAKPAAAAKTDAASVQKGQQLYLRAQKALGGAEKISAIKDFTHVVNLDVQTGQGAMKVKTTNQWIAPSHIRQTQELPFGKVMAYFDGKTGWLKTPQGEMPMPPQVVEQVKGEAFRNIHNLFGSSAGLNIATLGDTSVEITNAAGQRVTVEFDAASGLPAKMAYKQGAQSVAAVYSDWKDHGGIKHPSKIVVEQDGNKFADATVESFQMNTGLTVEQLSKKE